MNHTLYETISAMPFVDTHNHLSGGKLTASSFWEIGEYFWLLRHLHSAGYPQNAASLPFDARAAAYADALSKAENTIWARVLKRTVFELFGVRLDGVKSVYEADEAVRAADKPGRDDELAKKAGLIRYVENSGDPHADRYFYSLPRVEEQMRKWAAMDDPSRAAHDFVKGRAERGLMTSIPDLRENPGWEKALHALASALEAEGRFLELFVGVEDGWLNPPDVTSLYPIFSAHQLPINVVSASEGMNSDLVNAACTFPNVSVGGLWWYSFRPSAYLASMAQRYENLPRTRASLIATDAYCLEWCYAKSTMVRRLLADFLCARVDAGEIDAECALRVADSWLRGASAALYGL